MVKVKKKVSKCFVGTGTLIILFLVIGLIYLYTSRNDGQNDLSADSPSIRVFDRAEIEKQHSEVMKRATILSQKYKNVTGMNPPTLRSKSLKKEPNHKLEILSVEKQSSGMNIAIGMAQDTDPKNLVTFCASLRKYSSAADSEVVLFINTPVPARSRDIAKKYDILLIEFTTSAFTLNANGTFLSSYHPSSLRWGMIYNFFENINTRNRYSKVLLIDVRDSFFQSNPFHIIPNEILSVLYVFKGVESVSIGDCGWNGGWVKDCFGDRILGEIGRRNIICSGVSIGTTDVVYQYLTLMNDILMGRKESDLSVGSRFPGCERNGVDQGVHNVLVHKNMIKNLEVKSESDGKVVNMQGRTAIVSEKKVTNSRGIIFPIVHQYDRYPDLQKLIFSEYVDWVNTSDPNAEWNAEATCGVYKYRRDVDLFKARCDLKSQGGATSAASCCIFCTKNSQCKAFTFLDGSCHLKSCSDIISDGIVLKGAVSGYLTEGKH